jgi:hypothetical protein
MADDENSDDPIVIMTDEGEVVAGSIIEEAATEMRERLAALSHEQWSGWMRYLFSECRPASDGTEFVEIPAWAVKRWTRQMNTPYAELNDEEKESDRKEATRMIEVFAEFGSIMRMIQNRAVR